jgi:hypothetical protein
VEKKTKQKNKQTEKKKKKQNQMKKKCLWHGKTIVFSHVF